MLELRYRSTTEALGEKWDYCAMCGPQSTRSVLKFDSGSTEPTADETITGGTSGDTGTLESVDVRSGTWAGGDAAGTMVLTSPTGDNTGSKTAAYCFQDNENLNGSSAGSNFATANGTGSVVRTGVVYPECDLVNYQGKNYCRPHFEFKFRNKFIDEAKMNINEGDRGK